MKIYSVMFLLIAALAGVHVSAAEEVVYYHTNLQGSPIAATDDTGTILWERSYGPWGHPTSSVSEDTHGFTGAPRDEATGLSDLQARWYSPEVGRMQSLDPVRFQEDNIHSFNLYTYGNNNPYRYEDPNGESPVEIFTELLPALGRSSGALAAYAVGYYREDQALMQVALDGMNEMQGDNLLSIAAVFGPPGGKKAYDGVKAVTKGANKEITKSSRKRVKRLVNNLSGNSRKNNGLSQEKTDQLRRIVEKAGGKIRNDRDSGVKGTSAGKPHVQTEGLGKSIDNRHIWTKKGVQ